MWYFIVQSAVKVLIKLVARVHVEGAEILNASAPFIMASNHLTSWDPPLIFSIVPRQHCVTVLAADKWRKVLPIRWLFDSIAAVWVRRGDVDRVALSAVLAALKRGKVLGIAPEGTRSKTGALQTARNGVTWIAQKASAPIIPIAIWGVENIQPSLRKLRRADVYVNVGLPILFDSTQSNDANTDRVMREIAKRLPEQYRGVYG